MAYLRQSANLNGVPKKELSDSENMAVNVANLLVPLLDVIVRKSKPVKVECAVRINAYKLDELEQYGRRENLRISGFKEEENDDLKKRVIELAKVMGIDIDERDINVVHRIGKPNNGATAGANRARQIIVRFNSRDTKYEFLRQKKNLKTNEAYKQVFIFEDLTMLRQRLLYTCKHSEMVSGCYTRDGAIHCTLKNGSRCVIRSPDDLFHVGAQDVDFDDLKLSYLKF